MKVAEESSSPWPSSTARPNRRVRDLGERRVQPRSLRCLNREPEILATEAEREGRLEVPGEHLLALPVRVLHVEGSS
jgi:hypothetical protein